MPREIAGYTLYTAQEVMDMPNDPQPCLVDDFVYKGVELLLSVDPGVANCGLLWG